VGLVFDDVLEQTSGVSAGAVCWFGEGGGRSGERVSVGRSIAVLVFDERHLVRAGGREDGRTVGPGGHTLRP